jgi:hypothetical protein
MPIQQRLGIPCSESAGRVRSGTVCRLHRLADCRAPDAKRAHGCDTICDAIIESPDTNVNASSLPMYGGYGKELCHFPGGPGNRLIYMAYLP